MAKRKAPNPSSVAEAPPEATPEAPSGELSAEELSDEIVEASSPEASSPEASSPEASSPEASSPEASSPTPPSEAPMPPPARTVARSVPPEALVLQALRMKTAGASPTEIAGAASVSLSRAGSLLNGLNEMGLVRRLERNHFQVTPKGLEVLSEFERAGG